MRPKLLEIEGLQSFRDVQRIDFDRLGETGLFGIFGPTGSGKSTVLDAITFTLYGKVKRAERGTQGIINTNHKTAKVSFTFELLKDGSRKTYRVERTYQRKKDSDNSCEPKVVRLIEITEVGEIPLCDKASEVSSSIEELLGLSHDDFTRAVVLPQNSFQEFLFLDNAKKREMLERIFYLEEYGKQLAEKLTRKMSGLRSRIERLSGELKGYIDATDEAVDKARETLRLAAAERIRVETELKLLEAKYHEAKEVWQLVQELSGVEHKEQEHLALKETVNAKRVKLEKAVKADGLLEIIHKKKELFEKLHQTEQDLGLVMEKLQGVVSSLDEIKQKYEGLKGEAATEQPKLVGLKTRLADALGIKNEIQVIQEKINELQLAAVKLKQEISEKSGVIGKETAELAAQELSLSQLRLKMDPLKVDPEYRQQIQTGITLENEAKTLGANVNELNIQVEKLNEVIREMEERLNQIQEKLSRSQAALEDLKAEKQNHANSLPEDRNSVLKYKEEFHALQAVYDGLKPRKNELNGINSRLVQQQSSLKGLREKVLTLEKDKSTAEALYDRSKLAVEHAAAALNKNTAYTLSKTLKEGEACPVCGSEHHPSPPAPADGTELAVLEKRVQAAEKGLTEAEKALRDAENACLVEREKVKSLSEQMTQTAQELESKIKAYEAEKLRLPAELRALELEELQIELDKRNNLSKEKLQAIETWEKKQEEYQKEILRLGELLAQDKLVETGIAAALKVNRENRERSAEALEDAVVSFNAGQAKHLEFLLQHKIESAAAELKRLADSDREWNSLQKQQEQTQESLNRKKKLLVQLNQELAEPNSQNAKAEADQSNLAAQINDKKTRLKELAGDADIEGEIKRIDAKLEQYVRLDKQYQENIGVLEAQHNGLTAQKTSLENQKNIYSESHTSEEVKLKAALLDKGFADSDEVEQSVLSQEKQKVLSAEIDVFEQEERKIKLQKDLTLRKLDSRSVTEEEWKQLSNGYQEMAAGKEECVSQSEVAKNNYNLLKGRHEKYLELKNLFVAQANKYDLLDQIYRLLRGDRGKDNSFIDFIAEERLRYVAAKASETLALMTKYRYALELDTNAGFIIRDNANGGVNRPVNSLSGGETFLTSLALALALSEQIQLKGQSPLEFFFLDEGFGTLDSNLLDTVIDALERLSKKERVIGLISHVPELRSRIARRLIVDPPSSQGDGSRVKIELA